MSSEPDRNVVDPGWDDLDAEQKHRILELAEPTTVSRRDILAGGGALLAGGALGGGASQALSEPAAASHGGATIGTSGEPLEMVHTEGLSSLQSLDTDELLHTKDIVMVDSRGSTRLDPSTTTTPLQDATNDVAANGGGTVHLPVGTITEDATYNPARGVSVIGAGRDVTEVNFPTTGTSAHGFHMNTDSAGDYATFDGFRITGPGPGQTTGNGLRIDGMVSDVTIGSLGINSWADCPIYAATGLPFAWEIHSLRMNVNDPAAGGSGSNAHVFLDSAGPAWDFGMLHVAGTDTTQSATNADVLDVRTETDVDVDVANVGGAIRSVLRHVAAEGEVRIGVTNFEPDGLNSSVGGGIFRADDMASTRVESVRLNGTGVNHAYVYRMVTPCENNYFGFVQGDASPTTAVVNATDTAQGAIYEGVSTDVADDSGGTLSPGISCLQDLTIVT